MKRPMLPFYFSITLAILSSALYHFSARSTPAGISLPVSLTVTYGIALGLTLLTALLLPGNKDFAAQVRQLGLPTILLAVSIVGIEFGFLLAYRAGWNLGIAAVVVNVVASLLLVPVAIFIFKDQINWVNILGILVCLAGLVMLNWKR
jgi:multidrug transporter EmrE-like cation transporter